VYICVPNNPTDRPNHLSLDTMSNFIELNSLHTTQLTVVIPQLVTSVTCFGLVWPSSGLQRLVLPDDGQTRLKHVADVTSCGITTVNCVV